MRINVSIEDTLLTHTDEFAQKFSYTRSSLIAEALRRMIHGEKNKTKELEDVEIPPDREVPQSETPKNDGAYKGKKVGELTWEWCQANRSHPFVAAELRKCAFVSFFDGDGNPSYYEGKFFKEKWVCVECFNVMQASAPEGMRFEEVEPV